MNTKEFLTENKSEVINFFNTSIKGYYNTDLKSFMTDLMINFRKITLGVDLKKFDLTGNLEEAKSRLGIMSQSNFEYTEDKKTKALSKKYAGTSYMALV